MRNTLKSRKSIKRKVRTIKKRAVVNLDEAPHEEAVSFDYAKRQQSIIALARAVKPRKGWSLFDVDDNVIYSVVAGHYDDIGATTRFMTGEELCGNYRRTTLFTGDAPASLEVRGAFRRLMLPGGEFIMAKPFVLPERQKRSRLSKKRKTAPVVAYRSANSLLPRELPRIDAGAFDRAIKRLRAKSN